MIPRCNFKLNFDNDLMCSLKHHLRKVGKYDDEKQTFEPYIQKTHLPCDTEQNCVLYQLYKIAVLHR